MLTTAEITEKFDALILPGLDVPGTTLENISEKFAEYKAEKASLETQWGEWLRQKYAPALTPAAADVILRKVLDLLWNDYLDLEPFYEQEANYVNKILTAQNI